MSANLSIGTASAFVVATAILSLAVDKPAAVGTLGAGWALRGAIAPSDTPNGATPGKAATRNVPHWT